MKKSKVIKLALIIVPLIIYVTALILATFYDFEIAKGIAKLNNAEYVSKNKFGRFFETVGEMPIYLLVAFAGSILFINCGRLKNKTKKIVIRVALYLIVFCILFFSAYRFMNYIAELTGAFSCREMWAILAEILITLVSAVIIYVTITSLGTERCKRLLLFAFIIILTAIFSQLITQGVKLFWGRARYRTINALNNADLYSPWYMPQGMPEISKAEELIGITSDAFKSFPSGHTTAAGMMIVLTYLPGCFKRLSKNWVKVIFYVVAYLYLFIVALSRMVMGAHYLSDVLFGAGIVIGFYYLSKYIVEKTAKKLSTKNSNK